MLTLFIGLKQTRMKEAELKEANNHIKTLEQCIMHQEDKVHHVD